MDIQHIQPISFLYFRTETTVQELASFLPVGQELFREAVLHRLTITGPIHWHYTDFAGDITQPFTLEVALPIGSIPDDYDGKFHLKRTQPFRCLTATHTGDWLAMPHTYGRMLQHLADNGLTPSARNREIYINVDFQHPDANLTLIQLGIQ